MQSHLRLDGKDPCPSSLDRWHQSGPAGCWTVSCYLLTRGSLLSELLHRAVHNMAAHFFKASKESLLARWVTILWNLITYILKPLPYSMVRSKSGKAMGPRRWGLWGHPRAYIPQLSCWSASLMKVAPWTVLELGSQWSTSLCRGSWPGGSALVTSPTLLSSVIQRILPLIESNSNIRDAESWPLHQHTTLSQ